MKTCHACGQPVPLRWRNADRIITRLLHQAGPVVNIKAPARPGFPWGRLVDRVQSCTRCTVTLVRGPWSLFFDEGTPVVEHGAGAPAPLLLDEDLDGTALPCA